MKINEVIRTNRKKQNLTQEQIADYLGVTAPAVNKWEKGISYPDITLLAPLARVLHTDVDTLLSFHDELSDKEINGLIKEWSGEIMTVGFEKVFHKAVEKIREYPDCNKLMLYGAQVLNGYLTMGVQKIPDKEKYEKQIFGWYQLVACCSDTELAKMATVSLVQSYTNKGDYNEAQKLLDSIPSAGFDKRLVQAKLYQEQKETDKAYAEYERMIFQYSCSLMSALLPLIQFLCEQGEYDNAKLYSGIARTVSEQLDLGKYNAASADLMIVMQQKDEERTLSILEELVDGIAFMNQMCDSKLYRHMEVKKQDEQDAAQFKQMFKKSLEQDPDFQFIKDNVRFKQILQKLGE